MKPAAIVFVLGVGLALPAATSIPELPDREANGLDPRTLVGFRKCEITEVRPERTIVVWDGEDRVFHELRLSPKVKLRALNKRQFDGRKKLVFEDLGVGQRVKVNFRKTDMTILQIDVLPEVSD